MIALSALWALLSLQRRKRLIDQFEKEQGPLYDAFLARLKAEEQEAVKGDVDDFPSFGEDFDPHNDDLDWDQINAPTPDETNGSDE